MFCEKHDRNLKNKTSDKIVEEGLEKPVVLDAKHIWTLYAI